MSWICNSTDGDNVYNGNPFIIPQKEEVLPFFQDHLSPFYNENQLFPVPLAADECQQADDERISHMPLPAFEINMYTGQEILKNTPYSGTVIHQHNSMPNNSELKNSTLNKGSMARRSGKKDRHTKIKTAKGVRDRRMRLSVQIARKFFDLHDRLGFDKASKTIEWLFSKSKKAIDKLGSNASQVTQMSCNNSCGKGAKSLEISEGQMKVKIGSDQGVCEVSGTKKTQKSATRSTEHNAKDLRDNARARARKRTREKNMNRCLEESKWSLSSDQGYNCSQLGSAGNPNPLFEIGQESMSKTSSQDNISTSQSSIHHHLANMELLGPTTSPSESVWCSMYGYDLEKNGGLFSDELDSYSNNPFYFGWDVSAECLKSNSLDFLD